MSARINPFSDPACEKCGHVPEATVMGLIFKASMHAEIFGDDDGVWKTLTAGMKDISPELSAEFEMEGTEHPLACKTLSEIRILAANGELPTEGSEVRINRRKAARNEWNRRIHAKELTNEQIDSFRGVSSLEAMSQLGWENPY